MAMIKAKGWGRRQILTPISKAVCKAVEILYKNNYTNREIDKILYTAVQAGKALFVDKMVRR